MNLLRALAISSLVAGLAAQETRPLVQGRLEERSGLRILRVWGTPQERGYAHGVLLGREIVHVLALEWQARFARMPEHLERMRAALPRLVAWPERIAAELRGLHRGVVASGARLRLDAVERDLDLRDLEVANALDVFAVLACSGFTLTGPAVAGGGVLTARNFDWPWTGPHLAEHTLLVVQEPGDGLAFASVAWPGYVGAVTAVNEAGVAVFVHIGNGRLSSAPRPGSWPTAVATREVLERGSPGAALSVARAALAHTSPPASYTTRVVLPVADAEGRAEHLFEADVDRIVVSPGAPVCVVTNHFLGRTPGRGAALDSVRRQEVLQGILAPAAAGREPATAALAWEALGAVARDHRIAYSTVHSLVFRHDPWRFEVAIGQPQAGRRLVPAPRTTPRFALSRAELFPDRSTPR